MRATRRWRRRTRDEVGAVAILVAALSLVILMFAAYAVDIGLQVNRKHLLIETLDSAAQAGAYALPGDSVKARADAIAFAQVHDPTETGTLVPNIDFWCVVASTGTTPFAVDTTQIPSTCNPGVAPYNVGSNYLSTGRKITCSVVICAIPCVEPSPNTATPKIACNTIRVYQGRDVPFAFAPAGGIAKGGTGSLISVACKGSCGTIAPNPLDVAVVADRTRSMLDSDVDDMIAGIKGMLQQMTPSQQYVALGTIARSTPTTASQSGTCNSTSKGLTWPSSAGNSGRWVPISFTNDYLTSTGAPNPNSGLIKGLDCLQNISDIAVGTSLAAPMKAAARYLLGPGYDPNNTGTLTPAREPTPAPAKVLIFETDGQPNESEPTGGVASLTNSGDIFSNGDLIASQSTATSTDLVQTNTPTAGVTTYTHRKTITINYGGGGAQACNNLLTVAANARAAGILVIMIAYNLTGKTCNDLDGYPDLSLGALSETETPVTTAGPETNTSTKKYQTQTTTVRTRTRGTPVLNVMAAAASPINGTPSSNSNDCDTASDQAAENSDGDYFFCAATGTQMAPIFKTALSQASKGIKLIRIP